MENAIVVEGTAAAFGDDDSLRQLFVDCGRVLHICRLPGDMTLLQFALENQASLAMRVDVEFCVPTRDHCGSSTHARPKMRAATEEEYACASSTWRNAARRERDCRFAERGMAPMEYDLEIVCRYGGEAKDDGSAPGCDSFVVRIQASLDGSGTGSVPWCGGLLLAECLWKGMLPVKGLRVLELGCGCTALPSIVASHLHAKQTVASDLLAEVLQSASQNTCGHGVEVRRLDWGDHVHGRHSEVKEHGVGGELADDLADVVLWAEAVYTESGGFCLAKAVQAHLRCDGVCAAVMPSDSRPGMEVFEREMQLAGFLRGADCLLPADLVATAQERTLLPRGLGESLWQDALAFRFITWKMEDLYN